MSGNGEFGIFSQREFDSVKEKALENREIDEAISEIFNESITPNAYDYLQDEIDRQVDYDNETDLDEEEDGESITPEENTFIFLRFNGKLFHITIPSSQIISSHPTMAEILRVGTFVNDPVYGIVPPDESEMQEIIETYSFDEVCCSCDTEKTVTDEVASPIIQTEERVDQQEAQVIKHPFVIPRAHYSMFNQPRFPSMLLMPENSDPNSNSAFVLPKCNTFKSFSATSSPSMKKVLTATLCPDYNAMHRELCELKNRIQILTSEKEALHSELDECKSKISSYEKDVERLTNENQALSKSIEELKSMPISLESVNEFFKCTQPVSGTLQGWKFIQEMMNHMMTRANGRRHSQEFKEFAFIIRSASPRCLRILRTHLPFPCKETIRRMILNRYNSMQEKLLEEKEVTRLVENQFRSISNEENNYENLCFPATLAIDAVAVLPQNIKEIARECGVKIVRSAFNTQFLKMSLDKKENVDHGVLSINNMFIFYIEPLNPDIPCFPVHLQVKKGGTADIEIRNSIREIKERINKSKNIRIVNCSTDGDGGHQEMFDKQYEEMHRVSPTFILNELIEYYMNEENYDHCSTDMLHAGKCARIHFLIHVISLCVNELSNLTSPDEIIAVLKGKKECTDLSQIGKMRDVYAIDLFKFSNLIKILSAQQFNASLCFIPYVLWFEASLNAVLTPEARVWVLKLAFEVAKRHMIIMSTNREEWCSEIGMNGSSKKRFLTFHTKAHLKRLMVSLLSLIVMIQKEGEAFAFDRTGTHPLENFNGYVRINSLNYDTAPNVTKICARAQLVKECEHNIGSEVPFRGRVNTGGIRIRESFDILGPPECDPIKVADALFILANANVQKTVLDPNSDLESYLTFLEWLSWANALSSIKEYQLLNLKQPKGLTNQGINTRNIQSSLKNGQ